jgi:hypothetical protein
MTETQQRFLRSIAERVPLEHVVELHLFPPIRQGGVETGVAVVAEDPRRSVAVGPESLDDADTPTEPASAPFVEILSSESSSGDVIPVAVDADVSAEASADTVVDLATTGDASDDSARESGSEYNDAHADAPRYTIHTARYRLTLKGVDRGKWEVDVVAEADAPLEAVDAVVRGVQRRSGEGAEPDRLSTEALRDALELTLAQLDR